MGQYIETFAFSYGALKGLIDWLSTAEKERPFKPGTNEPVDVAGIRIEFNSSLRGFKDQADPCALAGYWDPIAHTFTGGGLNIIQSDLDTKKFNNTPPNLTIELSPGISVIVDVPDFEYVFFDAASLNSLNEYAKANENTPLYGVAFKRTINTFKDEIGVTRSYNNLLAYPYNDKDYNDTFHNPQSMRDSMTYAIGVPCPPLWRKPSATPQNRR